MDEMITKQYFDDKLDELARMVAQGFAHVEERFKKVDEQFARIDARFEKVDEQFARIDDRFREAQYEVRELGRRMDQQKERIDSLYDHVDGFITLHQKLDLELAALRSKYNRLDERMMRIESRPALA